MSVVVPLFTCAVCGDAAKLITIVSEIGDRVVDIIACDNCFDDTKKMLDRVRPVFTAMKGCGISENVMTSTMGFLLRELEMEEEDEVC